ncbi:DUF3530 family protein [Pseudomaricurvus alcaniphilus]|uniref:DUF3530 family protein n=1 Tax=Pseudomaricurvus alcaniphilus TaxID=1166482 RepID=UPI001408F7EE|nr:DUF3530 family protein [Pseudomaricurvus alcaniphilus]NHN37032.1 DUF3530 family protein [Pseudomaricurvus alcaniphilus]
MKDANCTEIIAPLLPAIARRRQRLAPATTLLQAGAAQRHLPRRRALLALLLTALLCQAPPSLAQDPAAAQNPANDATEADPATSNTPEVTPKTTPQVTPNPPQVSPDPPQPPRYQSREERDMQLLAEEQAVASAIWLTALDTPFLSLYQPDTSGKPVGAVLIVNAAGQHSDWPSSTANIRLSLPQFGWHTLSTELPAPAPAPVPERTFSPAGIPDKTGDPAADQEGADTENTAAEEATTTQDTGEESTDDKTDAAEPDSGAAPAEQPQAPANDNRNSGANPAPAAEEAAPEHPPEELALARLQASIDFLHQQGQFNIVLLGHGIGAARAACFIKQLPLANPNAQSRPIRALVLVNPRNHIEGSDIDLPECLRDPQLPVLDVYHGRQLLDRREAQARLHRSRRLGLGNYQQLRLPPEAHLARSSGSQEGSESRLARRVRGFLERHARGTSRNSSN